MALRPTRYSPVARGKAALAKSKPAVDFSLVICCCISFFAGHCSCILPMLRHSLSQVPNGGDEPGESDDWQLQGFPDSSEIAVDLGDWEHVQEIEPFEQLTVESDACDDEASLCTPSSVPLGNFRRGTGSRSSGFDDGAALDEVRDLRQTIETGDTLHDFQTAISSVGPDFW